MELECIYNLTSVAQIMELKLSVSLRRAMFIFNPLFRFGLDEQRKIRVPKFIFTVFKLLPHVLIINPAERYGFQLQIIEDLLALFKDSDNLETMAECYYYKDKLIHPLLAPDYISFLTKSPTNELESGFNTIFTIIMSSSIRIDLLRQIIRMDKPLGVEGMAVDGPASLDLRTYRAISKIVKRASKFRLRPPTLVLDNTKNTSSLFVKDFLPISPDTTLSELSSATGIAQS